ncbi:MAG TPA: antibiotic biosynthesis monooxygenase [Oceanobacillus sp.]|nr:antibiotic biosynthesis monooxygenase [Oceanobacillus sp.]
MILEIANLQVRAGEYEAFEAAYKQASPIIASSKGYISHELQRCMETPGRYVLLVRWETLEDHTVGFRGSELYQQWRAALHHFYDSALVEHYTLV